MTKRLIATSLAMLILWGCSEPQTCAPELSVALSETQSDTQLTDDGLQAIVGVEAPLVAQTQSCELDAGQLQVQWFLDRNGDQALVGEEQTPVAVGDSFAFLACNTQAQSVFARLVALTTDEIIDEQRVSVNVVVNTAPKPECVASSISAIQSIGDFSEAAETKKAKDAVACLEPYLAQNACDFHAAAASGLGQFGLFASSIPQRWADLDSLTPPKMTQIVESEIQPILDRYQSIYTYGSQDFVFYVEGLFRMTLFEDLPYLEGDETLQVTMQGEHDRADVAFFIAFGHGVRAAMNFLFAYEGLPEFFLGLPPIDQISFDSIRKLLVQQMESDSQFLLLRSEEREGYGPEGIVQVQQLRDRILTIMDYVDAGLELVARESDSQVDDLVRYWDCGSDGQCDCSTTQITYRVCPNDEGTQYTGPDDDGTELNGRYDPGEPIGTDRIALTEDVVLDLPANVDEFQAQLAIVRANVVGPDALDLNELVYGLPVDDFMSLMAIPYPEIRLSEWFASASHIRFLLPLYSRTTMDFVADVESEYFYDTGYDGLEDEAESIRVWPNPRGLTLGTEYDALDNPDPHFDNFDPLCSPFCTLTDGIDNDADGLTDTEDRALIQELDISISLPQELGIEANLMFDFSDLNADGVHQAGEPSEPFDDTGTMRFDGVLVQREGAWDFADRSHRYPHGDDVGPIDLGPLEDPANGVAADAQARRTALTLFTGSGGLGLLEIDYRGLFDQFYFFLPDPTFSGVLTFPETIVGVGGQELTENAKFHRFASKLIELGNQIQVAKRTAVDQAIAPLNLGAHRCVDPQQCKAAAIDLGWTQ